MPICICNKALQTQSTPDGIPEDNFPLADIPQDELIAGEPPAAVNGEAHEAGAL